MGGINNPCMHCFDPSRALGQALGMDMPALPRQLHLLGRAGPVGVLQQDGGQVVPADGRGKGGAYMYMRFMTGAWHGVSAAWHGIGMAWHKGSMARHGAARHSMAWHGIDLLTTA